MKRPIRKTKKTSEKLTSIENLSNNKRKTLTTPSPVYLLRVFTIFSSDRHGYLTLISFFTKRYGTFPGVPFSVPHT